MPDAAAFLFETPRLRCRRWTADDVDAVYALYSDPQAVRWVGDGPRSTPEACRTWMDVTARNYAQRGYGMFALEARDSGRLVGFCGLVHPGGQPEPEIKYAFLPAVWGQGLAGEAVPALLAYGARVHGLQRIVATVAPENVVSQKVLTRAGARLLSERLNDDGTTTQVFEWRAPSDALADERPA